jgi:hypothetical protein
MKDILKELKKLKTIQISLAMDSNVKENEYLAHIVEEIGKGLNDLLDLVFNYPEDL